MACLIDGQAFFFEYFPTKVGGAGREEKEDDEAIVKGRRGSRHGRLEKRAAFINASSQPQQEGGA